MVRTGDLLTGRDDCPIIHYMDTIYDLWDPTSYPRRQDCLLKDCDWSARQAEQESARDGPPSQPSLQEEVS
jgi:hypothetical protein